MKVSEELQQRKRELMEREWVPRTPRNENESCLVYDYNDGDYEGRTFKVKGATRDFLDSLCPSYMDPVSIVTWNDSQTSFTAVANMLDEATLIAKEKGL